MIVLERTHARRTYAELPEAERVAALRSIRVLWGCSGDVERAAAVERLIVQGAELDRRRHGRSPLQ